MYNNKSYSLIIGIAVFTILVVLRDIYALSIPSIAISMFFVALITLLPYANAVMAVFYLMPFAHGVPGYTILLSFLILLVRTKNINIWQIVPTVFIALLELSNVLFYNFTVNYNSVISYIGFIALFFFILFNKDNRLDKLASVRYFCIGVAFTLIIVYIPIFINHGFDAIIAGEARAGRVMGYEDMEEVQNRLVMNANSIAYYSIVLLSILLWGRNKLKISAVFYYFLLFIAFASGVCSFSRTWLLLTAIVIVLYAINSRYSFVSILAIIVAIFILFSTQNFIVQSVSDVFENRMQDETMETGGQRTVLFELYNEKWVTNPSFVLIGTGLIHCHEVINIPLSMHNGLQQIWVCHGVIGFMIFAFALIHYMRRYKSRKLPFSSYLPFLACFIFDQSIQFLQPYPLMLPFLPTLYILSLNYQK